MKKFLFIVLAIFTYFSSCKKDSFKNPIADFEYSIISSGTLPVEVVFSNKSIDATEYSWSFGDGTSSDKENPTIVYNNAGNYRVTLVARNKDRTDSASKEIQISLIKPSPDFTYRSCLDF